MYRRQGERASLTEALSAPGIGIVVTGWNPAALERSQKITHTLAQRSGRRVVFRRGSAVAQIQDEMPEQCRTECLDQAFWRARDEIGLAFKERVFGYGIAQHVRTSQVVGFGLRASLLASNVVISVGQDESPVFRRGRPLLHDRDDRGCNNGAIRQRSRAQASRNDLTQDHRQDS